MKRLLFIFLLGSLLMSCESSEPTCEMNEGVPEFTNEPTKIQFPSGDKLMITANLYDHGDEAPVIVLCHQAGFNKFEYSEIAKSLWDRGYTCLAIDQRSGDHIVEAFNETLLAAEKKGVPVEFLDAEQDIVAAVNYMAKKYKKKVILWGSSYSSTLALHIASENKNVDAVISFSPGNYFDVELGELNSKLANLEMPMFLTSSKEEVLELSAMLEGISLKKNQIQYIPKSEGYHGSRALWKTNKYNAEYWEAILQFLDAIKSAS